MVKVTAEEFARDARAILDRCTEQDELVRVNCGDRYCVMVSDESWKEIRKAMERFVEGIR